MDCIGIARSGLQASMARLTASASNIANAQSTGPVPGKDGGSTAYRPLRAETVSLAGGGVQARLAPADPACRLTYDPTSRDADPRGMVAAPDVEVTDELVDQVDATLAFQANLKLIATAADLERSSLQLWA